MSEHTHATHNGAGTNAPHQVTGNMEDINSIQEPLFVMKEEKFGFRTVEEENKELGEKFKSKRPDVKLAIPIPTLRGIAVALHDPQQQEYILGLVADAIISAARSQISDKNKPVNKQEELDLSKLTLEYLANEPKAERKGYGISEETWEAFKKDYISIMPEIVNRDVTKVTNVAIIFEKRLGPVRTNKPVLKALENYLHLWAQHSPNIEEFTPIYELLNSKFETYLNLTDEDYTKNI